MKFTAIVGFVLGILFASIIYLVGIDKLLIYSDEMLVGAGYFCLFIILMSTLIYIYKEKIIQFVFGVKSNDLDAVNDSISNLSSSIVTRNASDAQRESTYLLKQAFAYYTSYNLKRFIVNTSLSLFVAFGGLLGTVLLFNQNELINNQNEIVVFQNDLIARQNLRLDQQTNLQEAERRSALIFLLSNIMDALDDELKTNKNGNLSDQLIARIISLSQRFQPYRYLEDEKLVEVAVSPERGQLLINILNSGISKKSLQSILENGNFTYSYIDGLRMKEFVLSKANIDNSYFVNVTSDSLIFDEVSLNDIYFRNCKIDYVSFSKSNSKNLNIENLQYNILNLQDCIFNILSLSSKARGNNRLSVINSKMNNFIINSWHFGVFDIVSSSIESLNLNSQVRIINIFNSRVINLACVESKKELRRFLELDSMSNKSIVVERKASDTVSIKTKENRITSLEYFRLGDYSLIDSINLNFAVGLRKTINKLKSKSIRYNDGEINYFGSYNGYFQSSSYIQNEDSLFTYIDNNRYNSVRSIEKLPFEEIVFLLNNSRFDSEISLRIENFISSKLDDYRYNAINLIYNLNREGYIFDRKVLQEHSSKAAVLEKIDRGSKELLLWKALYRKYVKSGMFDLIYHGYHDEAIDLIEDFRSNYSYFSDKELEIIKNDIQHTVSIMEDKFDNPSDLLLFEDIIDSL